MPSFLKRISSFAGRTPSSIKPTKEKSLRRQASHQQKSTPYDNQLAYSSQNREPREERCIQGEEYSSDALTQSSNSTTPTLSSSSSLSLSLSESPVSVNTPGPSSSQQISEILQTKPLHTKNDIYEKAIPKPQSTNNTASINSSTNFYIHTSQEPSSSSLSPSQLVAMPSAQKNTTSPSSPQEKLRRSSMSSLSVLFHPRSRSMPMLQDSDAGFAHDQHQMKHHHSTILSPTSASTPTHKGQSTIVETPRSSVKRMSSGFPFGANTHSSNTKEKKSRPKSLSSMLLQNDQNISTQQPRLIHQSKSTRWANRGGIGTNEMMVDLETIGVFVPSNGRRLRAEFVYRSVIQCADEIRRRGLLHPNIFSNPSPKKVITAMIALMIDQNRCDLYPIQCLRIDTVVSLMLNLMSQMSNPIIPYAVMEHYFHQSGHIIRSSTISSPPSSKRRSEPPRPSLDRSPYSTVGDSLPPIPALPLKGTSRAFSHASYAWAREYFDLPLFLAILPAMNRVILLEVLHLCQELLEHQIQNRLTLTRLVQQVAPALFSTVFDQKILETMAGGSARCSVYGEGISLQDGSRAENHLFMVILVRFLHLSPSNNGNPIVDPSMNISRSAISDGGSPHHMQDADPYGQQGMHSPHASSSSESEGSIYENHSSAFRKSQQWHHYEQQKIHHQMERSFQEMEILQRPPQHFGYHPAKYSHAQQQQQQNRQPQSSVIDGDFRISQKMNIDPLRSPSQDSNTGLSLGDEFILPGPTLESGHRNHTLHNHRNDQNTIIM